MLVNSYLKKFSISKISFAVICNFTHELTQEKDAAVFVSIFRQMGHWIKWVNIPAIYFTVSINLNNFLLLDFVNVLSCNTLLVLNDLTRVANYDYVLS